MKNEDKIVELLSEYLKKHDQLESRFIKLEEVVAGQNEILKRITDEVIEIKHTQVTTNQFIGNLANSVNTLVDIMRVQNSNHEQRIQTLEKKTGLS